MHTSSNPVPYLRSMEQGQQVLLLGAQPHAAAAAAGRRLDHDGEPDLGDDGDRVGVGEHEPVAARDARHIGFLREMRRVGGGERGMMHNAEAFSVGDKGSS